MRGADTGVLGGFLRVPAQGRVNGRVRKARRLHAGMVIAAPWDFSVRERRVSCVGPSRARYLIISKLGILPVSIYDIIVWSLKRARV